MRRFRPTVRARLAAAYVALVGVSTGVLLAVSYWLLSRHFDRTLPEAFASDVRGEVALQYLLAFVGVVLVSAAVGWLVAGRLLAPLARITGAARRVSEERLGERIPVTGPDDELRELGETLNSMLDRLSGSFESQRRFVANASHELRSPLTVIRSEAEVALANPEPDVEELRAMAASVVEASRRTEALLSSLLILARSQRDLVRRERAELGTAARGAVDLLAQEARDESVAIELRLEPAWVEGDPALLERLAANLIENGLRYNRPGGGVFVTTRAVDGHAELVVGNSGPAVSAAAAARLAEPFERIERHAVSGGAGLGLSIVKAVSEAHGGSLRIEPRAEGGLEVTVRLPAAPAPAESRARGGTDSPGRDPGAVRSPA
ncbi:MAG TPA: ATP-binding protein [Thermoleophilaceae bacterium]|nr:ATP-binding protein [Thermoleophilaceae bacterium]